MARSRLHRRAGVRLDLATLCSHVLTTADSPSEPARGRVAAAAGGPPTAFLGRILQTLERRPDQLVGRRRPLADFGPSPGVRRAAGRGRPRWQYRDGA